MPRCRAVESVWTSCLKEQQAKDCLANAKDGHVAEIAEMQKLQKEKDFNLELHRAFNLFKKCWTTCLPTRNCHFVCQEDELHNAIESLKEAHRSALDRREATFKSKDDFFDSQHKFWASGCTAAGGQTQRAH